MFIRRASPRACAVLSWGEKSAAAAGAIMAPLIPTSLVLDEPTNDLDIEDALICCKNSSATSPARAAGDHDRDFPRPRGDNHDCDEGDGARPSLFRFGGAVRFRASRRDGGVHPRQSLQAQSQTAPVKAKSTKSASALRNPPFWEKPCQRKIAKAGSEVTKLTTFCRTRANTPSSRQIRQEPQDASDNAKPPSTRRRNC